MARVHEADTCGTLPILLGYVQIVTIADLRSLSQSAIKRQISKLSADEWQGMFGMNIKQEGISIEGDQTAFAHWTHVWRRVLEIVHDAHAGPTPAYEEPEVDEDFIVGRYTYLQVPTWGKCKVRLSLPGISLHFTNRPQVFYEQAGEGEQDIVFLHTAGSDSRQYHGVLNNEQMRKRVRQCGDPFHE